MGRSTGKLFKEKGVSLYKDKEISTTHAKIEMRNGQVFLIDAKSTNGTQLNRYVPPYVSILIYFNVASLCVTFVLSLHSIDVEPLTPLRLKDGDVVCMGSTELLVRVSDIEQDDVRADE